MMFLQPAAFLLLLGAAAIAVFYLLRFPREERRIPTTALWLRLREVARRTSPRHRTLISLAIQLLILFLITLAASRPYWAPAAQAPARTVALVVDCSASMQIGDGASDAAGAQRTRLDAARTAAQEVLASLCRRQLREESDRALLVQVTGEARIVQNITDDAGALTRALQRLRPSQDVADFTRAAGLLDQISRAYPGLEIYIFSDGQFDETTRKAWRKVGRPAPVDGAPAAAPDSSREGAPGLVYVPVGTASPNIGIVTFAARRNLDAPSDFEVVAEVLNASPEPATCRLDLRMSGIEEEFTARQGKTLEGQPGTGRLFDSFNLSLKPGEQQRHVVRQGNVPIEGIIKAEIKETSGGDVLDLDNTAAQVIPRTRRAHVVFITESQGDFLEALARADIGVQAYRLPPADYRPNLPVDAYVFVNHQPASLPESHFILVNTEGEVNLPTGVRPESRGFRLVAGEQVASPKVRFWDRHHPIMNQVSLRHLLLGTARKLGAPPEAETVVRIESGPLVLAFERGRQKMVFLGFDPRDSDIVFRTAFPLLLGNCARWFMEDKSASGVFTLRPGERKDVSVESAAGTTRVYTGSEEPQTVPVEDGRIRVGPFPSPGIHFYQDGKRLGALCVNLLSSVESTTPAAERLDVGEKVMTASTLETPVPGRRLWPWLGLLALVLLVVESYLYHRRIVF